MNEEFVTFEQAKKLKELGFDLKCHYRFNIDKQLVPNVVYSNAGVDSDDVAMNVNFRCVGDISAPTLAQAQKWLREKGIEVMSYYDYTTKTWIYEVCEIGEPHFCGYHSDDFDLNKSTYEEAISAGIDRALEIYF